MLYKHSEQRLVGGVNPGIFWKKKKNADPFAVTTSDKCVGIKPI